MRLFYVFSLISLLDVLLYAQELPHFMPMPQSVEIADGRFAVSDGFTVHNEGSKSIRVEAAIQRFLYRLSNSTRKPINWYIHGSSEQPSLTISYRQTIEFLTTEVDESYRISIDQEAGILLVAQSDIGVIRGLETLIQSLKSDHLGYYFPLLEIEDAPRFVWRGLMLDVCRHFMTVETVKRILDGMTVAKLNVFHWHLSEDQGFRIESLKFPLLHEKGSDGLYYTQDQVKDIITYADSRGIRVVPEFDMPGHTSSWMVGYPELASAPGPYEIERYFGVFDPTINPIEEDTYRFLSEFLKEMSGIFPDEYFHIGGDENNGKQWDANESIQQFMKEHHIPDNHMLQAYFNQRIQEILVQNGKKMMGWDEILQPNISKDILIQSWRGKEHLIAAAKEGYQTILSNGYYIDLSQSASYHYLNDPIPQNIDFDSSYYSYILGGEATMWSELVSNENVESRIWPRTLAIAERFWSPRHITDVEYMYERLFELNEHLERSGSNHLKNRRTLINDLSGYQYAETMLYFLDWLEPVEGYRRHGSSPRYTSYTPLTRPVDAANPDAERSVRLGVAIQRYMKNKDEASYQTILSEVAIFKSKVSSIQEAITANEHLSEILPLLQTHTDLLDLTLELIEDIRKNELTPQKKAEYQIKISQLEKPYGELELGLIPWIKNIINHEYAK